MGTGPITGADRAKSRANDPAPYLELENSFRSTQWKKMGKGYYIRVISASHRGIPQGLELAV